MGAHTEYTELITTAEPKTFRFEHRVYHKKA